MTNERLTHSLIEQLTQLAEAGVAREQWLARLLATLTDEEEAERYTLLRVGHVLSWGSALHAIRHISQQPNAATPIALTLYCLLRFSDDEARMMEVAASCGDEVKNYVETIRRRLR